MKKNTIRRRVDKGALLGTGLAVMLMIALMGRTTLPKDSITPKPSSCNTADAITNRDKTGTSAVQMRNRLSQEPNCEALAAGGAFATERGGFEPP
jgi:hypothetical protein